MKAWIFYYGIAVPADRPIRSHAELKGKTIGVTNMASAGWPARAPRGPPSS